MLAALIASIAALGFCWFCIHYHAPAIQADILERTRQSMNSANIAGRGLSVDGRNVLLRGVQGTPEISARAQELTAAVWGVNSVRIEVIPETITAPKPPSAAVTEVQKKLNDIVRLRNVEFQSGSAQLTAEGASVLNQVADALVKSSTLTVSIAGHTDTSGNPADNQTLSEARANSVRTYLIAKGVAGARMTAAGFGQSKPIADNATPDGRRRNRRIEFGVTGGGQAEITPAR